MKPISPSTRLPIHTSRESHTVLPSCLKMILINARSVNKLKKTYLIYDLIVDGDIDGAWVTWLSSGDC